MRPFGSVTKLGLEVRPSIWRRSETSSHAYPKRARRCNSQGGPLPRHPSQLYEAALEGLVLFVVLAALIFGYKALKRPGLVTGAFLAGYGIARFLVEYVREPDAHLGTLFGFITMGQILSLPLIALGAWMIHRAIRRT